jgi:hypothetical protein
MNQWLLLGEVVLVAKTEGSGAAGYDSGWEIVVSIAAAWIKGY